VKLRRDVRLAGNEIVTLCEWDVYRLVSQGRNQFSESAPETPGGPQKSFCLEAGHPGGYEPRPLCRLAGRFAADAL